MKQPRTERRQFTQYQNSVGAAYLSLSNQQEQPMNATKQFTRRAAAGLLLAGASLPVAKAFATHHRGQDVSATIDANGTVVMATFSGALVTAAFESELQI